MNTIEYENHRRAAVRAYGNQFATGQYRVRLTDSDGTCTFAFRNPRTARRFLRNRTRPQYQRTGFMYRVDLAQQAQEFRNAAALATSFGNYSTLTTVIIADTICH
jgi:hypothetical protein